MRRERVLLGLVAACVAVAMTLEGCSTAQSASSAAPSVSPADTPVTRPGDSTMSATIATTTAAAGQTGGSPTSAVAGALLTPADVQKVSGLVGVRLVPKDPMRGAGGDLNFASADGKLLLFVSLGDANAFAAMKDTPNYNKPVRGIGDAAFSGPAPRISTELYQLGFKKGNEYALLTTFFSMSGNSRGPVRLTQSQLKKLALIVVGRWK